MTSEDAAPKVGRTEKMGLFGAISYIIGNIVGSGIFITPATIVTLEGSVGLSLIVWVLSAFIATLGAFCYVELGTSIRKSGADFAYLCYVKWYPIAFAFMCTGCIIIYPATLAIQADTFSEYVFKGVNITLESDTQLYFAKKLTGFSLVWFLLFLNFFSLKTIVSRFNIVASIAKIAATGLVIGTGFYFLIFQGMTQNIADPFKGTTFAIGSFVSALFSGLYSYDGWDILNFGAEEIENPKRTMPLAIIFGMTFIALLYFLVNLSYFIIVPIPNFTDSIAQTFGEMTLGSFQFLIPVFVALLLIGSLNSTMFSASRYLQAAAKQGHLPSCISCINPLSDSPRVALLVHVLLAMGISFAGDLNQLINYVSFSQWSQRGCTMAALLYIRFTHKPVHPERIRTFILMPILFCLLCCTLVVVTIVDSFDVSVVGIGIVLAGFIFFFLFIFEKSLPAIPAYRENSQKLNEMVTIWSQIIFNVMPELDYGEEEEESSNLNKIHPEVPSIQGSFSCEDDVKRRPSALSNATQSTNSSTRF